jgi:hypothetical protein
LRLPLFLVVGLGAGALLGAVARSPEVGRGPLPPDRQSERSYLDASANVAAREPGAAALHFPHLLSAFARSTVTSDLGARVTDIAAEGPVLAMAAGARLVMAHAPAREAPSFVGSTDVLTASLDSVVLHDGYAWATVPVGPLHGFDVRDPSDPRLVSTTTLPGAGGRYFAAAPLAAGPDVLYVGMVGSIHRLDVSDPVRPSLVASVDLPTGSCYGTRDRAYAMAQSGDHVFVEAYPGEDCEAHLVSIDWSNPTSPRTVTFATLEMVAARYELVIAGSWLCAVGPGFARFYDVTDPSAPQPIGWAGPDRMIGSLPGARLEAVDEPVLGAAAKGERAWLGAGPRFQEAFEIGFAEEWPPALTARIPQISGPMLAAGEGVLASVQSRGAVAHLTVVDVR